MKFNGRTLFLIFLSQIGLTTFSRERDDPYLSLSLHSDVMDRSIDYYVLLPDEYAANPDKIYPILYAFHGLGASPTGWVTNPDIVEAVNGDYPTIVVTYSGGSYWYVDYPDNPLIQYKTFFFNELMPYVESTFRTGRSKGNASRYRILDGRIRGMVLYDGKARSLLLRKLRCRSFPFCSRKQS